MSGIAAAVGKKHGVVLDPADPLFLVNAIYEELHSKTIAEIRGLLKEAHERDVAAGGAAKGVAETLISEAGRWSAGALRSAAIEAGETVAQPMEALVARLEATEARIQRSIRLLMGMMIVSVMTSLSWMVFLL